jgi:2-dehydropantoate 2-reductase
MTIAVLGPGGVGGLVAGALDRAGEPVVVIAREATARTISERGLHVRSVRLGDFVAHPRALAELDEPVDTLIVATKATTLREALERIAPALASVPGSASVPAPRSGLGFAPGSVSATEPGPALVLPLLNGLDHLAPLRARFGDEMVVAGTIRVEADRPQPGVVVHTSPFLRIDMASRFAAAGPRMRALATQLEAAGIPARVRESEPQVLWSKLVRLNALACTTSAFDKLLGEIRDTPQLRAELVGAIEEGCAVANADGARIDASDPLGELNDAHATLGSSMQRDIAAGRPPELDAIPGAVLRAAARHGLECPTIEGLVASIVARAGVPAPVIAH